MSNGLQRWPRAETPDVVVHEQALPRILHVEDDASIARCVAAMLRRAGYEVVSVATAEAAALELAAGRYDAVVSDWNLAGRGTGGDVLIAAGSLPFLFLTSDDRADSFGVPRLDKPASPMAIRVALAAVLQKEAA